MSRNFTAERARTLLYCDDVFVCSSIFKKLYPKPTLSVDGRGRCSGSRCVPSAEHNKRHVTEHVA